MSVTGWRVETRYDGSEEDHWQSQQRIRSAFYQLTGRPLKWLSGRGTPANWLGYTEENPSPGYDIHSHYWFVDTSEHAAMLMLLGGNGMEPMELT